MSTQYDSEKIRQLARRIGSSADVMSDVNSHSLNSIMNEIPDNFCGSAADALDAAVDDLIADVRAVTNNLREIRSALNNLASRVEAADREAAALIKKA